MIALEDLGMRMADVPPLPPEELDEYLDAAARCFLRFGVGRTRVPDVAAEVGKSRVTVYRQVGTVDNMARLLLARDLHRLLRRVPAALSGRRGPEAIVSMLEVVVEHARNHPVLMKVLRDEPQLIGPVLISDLGAASSRIAEMVAPILDALMDSGQLARRDSRVVAEWLVRQTVTLILAPPQGNLRTFLSEFLVPALSPAKARR
jgi:AcrR family transcriptional regulator